MPVLLLFVFLILGVLYGERDYELKAAREFGRQQVLITRIVASNIRARLSRVEAWLTALKAAAERDGVQAWKRGAAVTDIVSESPVRDRVMIRIFDESGASVVSFGSGEGFHDLANGLVSGKHGTDRWGVVKGVAGRDFALKVVRADHMRGRGPFS